MDVIDSFSGPYRWLSNFGESPFTVRGITYKTNEHFYQAMKATTKPNHLHVAHADTPAEAKRLGREVIAVRADWDKIKERVMAYGLRQKFWRNPELAHKLMATNPAQLIEGNRWGDTYWGVCRGQGLNRLGVLLMQRRTALLAARPPLWVRRLTPGALLQPVPEWAKSERLERNHFDTPTRVINIYPDSNCDWRTLVQVKTKCGEIRYMSVAWFRPYTGVPPEPFTDFWRD